MLIYSLYELAQIPAYHVRLMTDTEELRFKLGLVGRAARLREAGNGSTERPLAASRIREGRDACQLAASVAGD